jgi:predicted outer membrane lipoprotein
MEVLLIAAVIVVVWLVLSHIRRRQFLKEYLALQRQALEKGVALPGDLKEIAAGKTDWAALSLRVGIVSLILGCMGVVVGVWILPRVPLNPRDADAAAIFASFWAVGLLLAAFGIGNLISWFLIDKKRRDRKDKSE